MPSRLVPILKVLRGGLSRRRFTVLGVLLVAAIAGADVLVIAMQRQAAIEAFRTAAGNLAGGIGAQTARSFDTIDTVLRGLGDGLTAPPAASGTRAPPAATAVTGLMQEQLRFLPAVGSLAALDRGGRVVAQAGPWPPGLDIAVQDVFRHLIVETPHDPPAMFIGAPVRDRVRGTWTSLLARRIDDRNGTVAGLVVAAFPLAGLVDFYRLAMPPRRTVTLARTDGVVLARFPNGAAAVGRNMMMYGPWRGAVAAGGGSYLAPGFFDGIAVMAVARPLPGLKLIIETAISQNEVLAAWRAELPWMIAGGVAASLTTVGLLHLFAGQVRRLARKNRALATARGQLDVAMSNITQGLCFFDGAQRLIVCNRRFGDLYNLPAALMRPGVSFREILAYSYATNATTGQSQVEHVMARDAIARTGQPHHAVIEMTDGRTIAIQQQPMPDGGWVSTHEDITERRRAEDKISFMARHDTLTGLPNRSLLHARIGEALARAARGAGFAILFLDLDRFKAVNDTLGHGVGDTLLREVAGRLQAAVRDADTVARLGGDEFVVLQSDVMLPEACAVLAERIINTVAAPYCIAGNDVVIGVSIGIDMATCETVAREGDAVEDILNQADMALYTAKAEGRGTYRFFVPAMNTDVQSRHALEADLRCALARGEFELLYQPIVSSATGRACGFEALLRWNHPVRGVVTPDHFLAVAEDCGVINQIGEWVVAQACREAAAWPPDLRIAVNISPVQLRTANLVEVVRHALAASGIAASRLELEITEQALLHSTERNLAVLHKLRACGVAIVMDDFGAGHSTLNHLRLFAFDRLKIDCSFVNDLVGSRDAIYMVRAILGLCRDLGIRTTAEGVETSEQLAILLAEGCTDLQGYLFSRPKPAARLEGLIMAGRLMVQEKKDALS